MRELWSEISSNTHNDSQMEVIYGGDTLSSEMDISTELSLTLFHKNRHPSEPVLYRV